MVEPDSSANPVRANSKRGKWRPVLRVAVPILSFYVLLVLAAAFFQRELIYFPTRLNPGVAERMAEREGLLPWRNQTGHVIGWKLPAEGPATGSVLIVHGNAGCAIDRVYFAKPIHAAAAVDAFILEYPGYGARDGSPSERSLLAAADEAFDLLPLRRPVFIVSESLGAGVAAHLARNHREQVSGLILFAPYDTFISVAQKKMPLLPVRLLLRDRYDPAAWLKNYHGPMAVVLAGADEIIPIESGRRLYEGYDGPKNIEIIPGAGHNRIQEQSPDWWKKIFVFWETNGVRVPSTPQ